MLNAELSITRSKARRDRDGEVLEWLPEERGTCFRVEGASVEYASELLCDVLARILSASLQGNCDTNLGRPGKCVLCSDTTIRKKLRYGETRESLRA